MRALFLIGMVWLASCSGPAPTPDLSRIGDAGNPGDFAPLDLAAPPDSSPSCVGLAKTCGPQQIDDCCASGKVPGATFNRSNDVNYPATVSDFQLDKYLSRHARPGSGDPEPPRRW